MPIQAAKYISSRHLSAASTASSASDAVHTKQTARNVWCKINLWSFLRFLFHLHLKSTPPSTLPAIYTTLL